MQKLLSKATSPVLTMTDGVSTAVYRSGSQMATNRSNAMASRITDSAEKVKCRKNIWVRQAPKEISPALNQNTASILGTVVVDSTRSATASMDRRRYMGWWRLRSVLMTNNRTPFPSRAARYMEQNGMEIQMCNFSMPGMPARRNVTGLKLVRLHDGMFHLKATAEDTAERYFRCLNTSILPNALYHLL